MRIYTIHVPDRWSRTSSDPDLDTVAVKEGFCWPAFFFSVLWALWNRLWLVALGFVLLNVAVGLVAGWFVPDPVVQGAVSIGIAILIGGFANDLKRWTLGRHGFEERAVVIAGDKEDAVIRYLVERGAF